MHSCPEAGWGGEEVGNMKSYLTFSTKNGQQGHGWSLQTDISNQCYINTYEDSSYVLM